jgi:Ser/Thr protein kinase RdoA (MazF antagonist)
MEEFLKKWEIGHIDTIAPTGSTGGGRTWFVRTAGGSRYVLKESNLARAEQEHGVILGLSGTQVPVAVPVRAADGNRYIQGRDGQVYSLYPRLPGDVVPDHYAGDARQRARGFGRAIGLLHTGLRELDGATGFPEMALVTQIDEWAMPRIREGEATVYAIALERIWQEARSELEPVSKELPRQLIHRDPHPSNMLFSAGQLTGWVDFELVRRGPRLFDLCYCASSLLFDGFEDEEKGRLWPALFRFMVRGYEESYPLKASERRAVYGVFVAIELIFVAFWLDRSNEDGARQCERLLYWLAAHRDALMI